MLSLTILFLSRYRLRDGEIMEVLAKTSNFTPQYFTPRDNRTFGYIASFRKVGALGEIENGSADIMGNLLPIKDYGQESSEYLFPAYEVDFAFLTPKMNSTSAVSFFEIFTIDVYVCLVVIFAAVDLIWISMHKFRNRFVLEKVAVDCSKVALNIFGQSMLMSLEKRTLDFERCLFFGWAFFSMIFCYTYQATMLEHLTRSEISHDFVNLQQLADSNLSIVTYRNYGSILRDLAESNETTELYEALYSKQGFVSKPEEALDLVAFKRTAALMLPSIFCRVLKNSETLQQSSTPLVHLLNKGPPSRFGSFLVPKISPFKDRFNRAIMIVRESGFIGKWRDDLYYELGKTKMRTRITRNSVLNLQGVYTMKELTFIFLALLVCCWLLCSTRFGDGCGKI